MKVILKEQVRSLGNIGDVVTVSPGYARNYLIPQCLAIVADEQNQRFIADQQRRLTKKIVEEKKAAVELRKKINSVSVELFKRVGGNGKLFGAVTNTDIVNELKKQNLELERRWISFDVPIKELGNFEVNVNLFTDVSAKIKVKVLMDLKQVEELKKKSEAKKKSAVINEEEVKVESKEEETGEESEENNEETPKKEASKDTTKKAKK